MLSKSAQINQATLQNVNYPQTLIPIAYCLIPITIFNANLLRTNYDASELANRRAESFLKILPLKKGDKVLDIATGKGLIAIPVAEMIGKNATILQPFLY